MKAPELHKRIPARKPCVTDVLCNWEIQSQIIRMCVCDIILGPKEYAIFSRETLEKCSP